MNGNVKFDILTNSFTRQETFKTGITHQVISCVQTGTINVRGDLVLSQDPGLVAMKGYLFLILLLERPMGDAG